MQESLESGLVLLNSGQGRIEQRGGLGECACELQAGEVRA